MENRKRTWRWQEQTKELSSKLTTASFMVASGGRMKKHASRARKSFQDNEASEKVTFAQLADQFEKNPHGLNFSVAPKIGL
jgi:hypothetical protein